MQIFKIVTAFLVPLLLSACCPEQSDQLNTQNNQQETPPPAGGEQTIQINKSYVTAEVDELFYKDDENFIIRASILDVREDPAYTSMAMAGSIYILIPNFQLDNNMNVMADSETNKNLSALAKLKKGDKFNAEVFFDKSKGWFIQQVITR